MKKFRCGAFYDAHSSLIKCLLMTKLAILLIFFASIQSFAKGYGQTNINLELEKVKLEKAFKAIEEQGFFRFVYKAEILPKDHRISIRVQNASLDDVLKKILVNTSLTYRRLSDNLVVITNIVAFAEIPVAMLVSGKVTNNKGEPLSGVSIVEKGTNNGTTTKEDGNFSLQVTNKRAVLVFSYIGFRTQEISVSDKTQFSITMLAETSNLNDVVVVGYGTQRKLDVTGAISTVSAEEIAKRPLVRLEDALQGTTPGVAVQEVNGNPGSGLSVRIRGANSITGSNDPLYVVDGYIGAPLGSIDPSDIESLQVL
ncbi:MAG TPA: carboxypeptidase-like regulatory domain-containing protein, partial [Puia sp.]|nr:carboxypeptidase-like regulatory domain-containing protein [Puia sp.]